MRIKNFNGLSNQSFNNNRFLGRVMVRMDMNVLLGDGENGHECIILCKSFSYKLCK
jgi:hypothetical protein